VHLLEVFIFEFLAVDRLAACSVALGEVASLRQAHHTTHHQNAFSRSHIVFPFFTSRLEIKGKSILKHALKEQTQQGIDVLFSIHV